MIMARFVLKDADRFQHRHTENVHADVFEESVAHPKNRQREPKLGTVALAPDPQEFALDADDD